jgi:hypothetical protein
MESSSSYKTFGINYGIIFGAYSILVLLLSYVLDFSRENWGFSLVNFIITIGIAGYAVYSFRKNNALQLSIGQAVKIGLIVGAIGGLIYAVYMYIHYTMVDTAFIETMKEDAMKAVEESSKGQPKEEVEMAKKITAITASPFIIATVTLIGVLIKTVLVGLVAGFIFRNER